MNENENLTELLPGMTTEEMGAMFFNDALKEPLYKVYQLNSKGHRYYYRFNDDNKPEFYPSVTTILSQTMPTPPHLVQWIADKGMKQAEAYKQERAYYGTFMHAAFEKLLIERVYDLDALKVDLLQYMEYNKLPGEFINYADDLKKDVLAFAQFVIDYDVQPLAIEIALVHPLQGYAGMIDLPCTMKDPKNPTKRINAIVDFKSGKKGFYEEHEIQLHLYKELWNFNYPDTQITKVFNFSPKDWRKAPTYNLKDQTEAESARKIPHLLALAALEDDNKDNVFTSVSGIIQLDADKASLKDNVTALTLAEIVTKHKEETPDAVGMTENEAKSEEETPNLPGTAQKSEKGTNVPSSKENAVETKNDKNNLLNDEIEL